MKYLLDTNICAFFLRGKFDIDQEIDKVGWKNCYISEITVLELKYGVELSKQKDGINREPQLERFLSTINIVPITGVLSLAAQEKIRLRLAGTPADDDFDLLIGCTSVVHRMTMVTDNTKDFKHFKGIMLTNWVKRP
ncbi:MAG: PIN domain-containing protein [Bacteroidaceae bacterium]|nr:PIN domain-containing protein [Bacteroidaceae bacterium]